MFKKRVVSMKGNIRQRKEEEGHNAESSEVNGTHPQENPSKKEEEEEAVGVSLADALALRKLRQQAKSKGVDAMALLVQSSAEKDGDSSAATTATATANDPLWDLRNGGLVTREQLDQKKA